MAITNRYSGFTQFNGGSTDRDSDFGENLNLDVRSFNTGDNTVTNSYNDSYNNRFGASSFYSTNEQRVAQSMITESININGITVRYMPRMSHYPDDLWNERPESVFDRGTLLDVFLESTSGFEGEGDVMTQYGIEFKEEVILRLSIPRFETLYSNYFSTLDSESQLQYDRIRPLEGDLIVIPFGRTSDNKRQYLPKVFEILKVNTFRDGAFFQLGDNFQYKIRARLFELSGEDIGFKPNIENSKIESLEKDIPYDSDKGQYNISRDSDVHADSWADNVVIEQEAQEQEVYSEGKELKEKNKVIVDDYTSTAFGYPSIITDLDDI